MNAKRTSVTVGEMMLWTAVLLAAVLLTEFDEQISAFIGRHIGMLMFLLVAGSTGGAGYFAVSAVRATTSSQSSGLPHTWSSTLDQEPGCDLCGALDTAFACSDHKLNLCTACTQRHDSHYRCNIRYVPAIHDAQQRRVRS